MPARRSPEGPPVALFLALAGAAMLYLLLPVRHPPPKASPPQSPSTRAILAARVAALATTPDKSDSILGDIVSRLASCPEGPGQVIREILDSGADARTGETFRVGARGIEATATLRGWLHDAWFRLCPEEAREAAPLYAALALHAEEWAVALRNAVAGDPARARSPAVRVALEAGHARSDWHSDPAFLEAIDILVLAGEPRDLAALSALGDTGDQALQHAVLLGADRILSQRDDSVIVRLAADASLFAWRVGARGALLARADTSRPTQRAAVESFLREASGAEAAAFLDLYPLHHYTIGPALASRIGPPDLASVAASDARAARDLAVWLADTSLARHRPLLLAAASRLEAARASAARGGFADVHQP